MLHNNSTQIFWCHGRSNMKMILYLENIYFLLGFICFWIFIIFRIIICDGQTHLILLIFIYLFILFFYKIFLRTFSLTVLALWRSPNPCLKSPALKSGHCYHFSQNFPWRNSVVLIGIHTIVISMWRWKFCNGFKMLTWICHVDQQNALFKSDFCVTSHMTTLLTVGLFCQNFANVMWLHLYTTLSSGLRGGFLEHTQFWESTLISALLKQ